MTIDKTLAPSEDTGPQAAVSAAALPVTPSRWLVAVIRETRPRQWPKNLLVFAAPLAAASLGRNDGFGYALLPLCRPVTYRWHIENRIRAGNTTLP